MNKINREIVNIIENQIENQPYEIQIDGLSNKQLEEINNFVKAFTRSGLGPYPLKMR